MMKRKAFAFFLTGCILFTAIPFDAYASETLTIEESGASGTEEGTEGLIIEGTVVTGYEGEATEVVIPNGVTKIGDYAFAYCSNLRSITIPEGVTEIGNRVFDDCSELEKIEIPSSVTWIGECAFRNTKWLEQKRTENPLVIVHNILIDGKTCPSDVVIPSGVTKISGSAFSYCQDLTSITIPEGVTEIGDYAFQSCSNLRSITIPEGVTEIGNRVFNECSELEEIEIPSSVTRIGEYAFNDTKWLAQKKTENPLVTVNNVLIAVNRETCPSEVTIPDEITQIVGYAFNDCISLTSITIPEGVTEIGEYAFGYCSNLRSIKIPSKVTTIAVNTFLECGNLENIEIPSGVTEIGVGAFDNTKWLEQKRTENPLVIVNNILIDGKTCPSDVVIPSGVTKIGEYAFSYCSSLTSIEIPSSVTEIGKYAFAYCGSLMSIEIPSSVTRIGGSAFSSCSDSFTICGKSGSYAETYANENQIPFKQLYTVTFDANSGTNLSVSKKKIEKDKAIGTLPTVEKEGYTFIGWYTDAAGGTKVTEGTVIKEDTTLYAQWAISIEQATVTLAKTSYTYDGTAKTPSVTVKLGNKTLVKDRDYTVKYDNNKAVGTAKVTITGNRKGGYIGTVSTTFTISTASIEAAKVSLAKTSYTYDGTAKTPGVTVKLGNKTLVKDRDYTVKYNNNKAVGTAKVTITGNSKGGYTGTVSKTFTISAASLKKAKVSLSTTSYTYNGEEKRPSVTVKLGRKTLKKNTDYTVSYKNNKNIGTATVTIKGKGSYTGTVSETFSIRVKKGTTFTSGTNKYKVTGTSTVAFSEIASNKTTKVTIPKTVKYGGKTFKVTSIAGSALKGKTKVTQVTIGENVETIGASAFYGCKNVKTITIKSTNLNKVGTKAFKGIHSKATIKVPKSKLSGYKKLLKGKGQGSKVKIVK